MKNQIQIEKEKIQELYHVLTNYPQISKKQVANEMHKCFGEDIFNPKDIRERIKTFEDACNVLGKDNPDVIAFRIYCRDMRTKIGATTADVESYLALRIICAALNEGWKPEFTKDEYRYYPWFYIYTKEEYDKLDEDYKKTCRVVGRSSSNAYASGGIVYANAHYASSNSYTSSGSRLAFKNRELAEYCGKQFIETWCDFLF